MCGAVPIYSLKYWRTHISVSLPDIFFKQEKTAKRCPNIQGALLSSGKLSKHFLPRFIAQRVKIQRLHCLLQWRCRVSMRCSLKTLVHGHYYNWVQGAAPSVRTSSGNSPKIPSRPCPTLPNDPALFME